MSMLKIAAVLGTLVTLGAAAPALADECQPAPYVQQYQAPAPTYYAPAQYVAPPVTYYTPAPRYYAPPRVVIAPRFYRGHSWGRVGWGRGWGRR